MFERSKVVIDFFYRNSLLYFHYLVVTSNLNERSTPMNIFPKEELLKDFKIKTLVQQAQFEQWLTTLFYINNELSQKWDFVYQEMFYVKFYELTTEGLSYAHKVIEHLTNGKNENKLEWYNQLVNGLTNIKSELLEEEYSYIEYRRHNTCHIFQNSYEHIQDNLKIKKTRKDKDLQLINNELKKMLIKHGSDKNIDIYLNVKLQSKLTNLYVNLQSIYDKKYKSS